MRQRNQYNNNRMQNQNSIPMNTRVLNISRTDNGKFLNSNIAEVCKAITERTADVLNDLSSAGTVFVRIPNGYTAEQTVQAYEALLKQYNACLGTFGKGTKHEGQSWFVSQNGGHVAFIVRTDDATKRKAEVDSVMEALLHSPALA